MAETGGTRRMTVVEGDADARVRAAVRSIALHARDANLERAARLVAVFDVAACDGLSDADRDHAIELAHQLVGSAGTFGFPAVSQLASQLERFFAENGFTDPDRRTGARMQLDQLQTHLAGEPDYLDET